MMLILCTVLVSLPLTDALEETDEDTSSPEAEQEYNELEENEHAQGISMAVFAISAPVLFIVVFVYIIKYLSAPIDRVNNQLPATPGPMPPPHIDLYRCPWCRQHRQYVSEDKRWYCERCDEYQD